MIPLSMKIVHVYMFHRLMHASSSIALCVFESCAPLSEEHQARVKSQMTAAECKKIKAVAYLRKSRIGN